MKKTKDFTENEKYLVNYAHLNWSEQAKNHMLYKKPFTDKTLKYCLKRIVPSIFE